MKERTDAQPYAASSLEVLKGLEPIDPDMGPAGGLEPDTNPLMRCALMAWLAKSVEAARECVLTVMRQHRQVVSTIMARIRERVVCLKRRASMFVGALRELVGSKALARTDDYDRCWRYALLIGEHDEARRGCGTWGLAAL